jgi:hypothetical protein
VHEDTLVRGFSVSQAVSSIMSVCLPDMEVDEAGGKRLLEAAQSLAVNSFMTRLCTKHRVSTIACGVIDLTFALARACKVPGTLPGDFAAFWQRLLGLRLRVQTEALRRLHADKAHLKSLLRSTRRNNRWSNGNSKLAEVNRILRSLEELRLRVSSVRLAAKGLRELSVPDGARVRLVVCELLRLLERGGGVGSCCAKV